MLRTIHYLQFVSLILVTNLAQASVVFFPNVSMPMLSIAHVEQHSDKVDVSIAISGLGFAAAPSLGSYDVDLSFDANQLAFDAIEFGDPLLGNQLDLFGFGDNVRGASLSAADSLNIYEWSLDSADDLHEQQADSFTLARVSFIVLQASDSFLSLAGNALADADGNSLSAVGMSVPLTTTVPLPPAAFLMLSGLIGMRVTGNRLRTSKRSNDAGYPDEFVLRG